MKKIYIILLLATFSLNLFCQQDSVIVLDSTYFYYWDADTNDWVGNWIFNYAFDANGLLTETIEYHWNYNTNVWVGVRRDVYTYDANGNQTEWNNYTGNSETNGWINHKKTVSYCQS